jgi:hypothetical protein
MKVNEYSEHLHEESIRLKALLQKREELYEKIVVGMDSKNIKKSYNQDETLMYVYIQTNHGNINITLDLIENLNN